MFGVAPAMRRTGLVLAAAVIVCSALAAANAVPVGELSVGQIEDELQVFHAKSDTVPWIEANLNQKCPLVESLNEHKRANLPETASLTSKIFSVLFPGSPAVNALLATLYISGPPSTFSSSEAVLDAGRVTQGLANMRSKTSRLPPGTMPPQHRPLVPKRDGCIRRGRSPGRHAIPSSARDIPRRGVSRERAVCHGRTEPEPPPWVGDYGRVLYVCSDG